MPNYQVPKKSAPGINRIARFTSWRASVKAIETKVLIHPFSKIIQEATSCILMWLCKQCTGLPKNPSQFWKFLGWSWTPNIFWLFRDNQQIYKPSHQLLWSCHFIEMKFTTTSLRVIIECSLKRWMVRFYKIQYILAGNYRGVSERCQKTLLKLPVSR